jgi:hypothetical protein
MNVLSLSELLAYFIDNRVISDDSSIAETLRAAIARESALRELAAPAEPSVPVSKLMRLAKAWRKWSHDNDYPTACANELESLVTSAEKQA